MDDGSDPIAKAIAEIERLRGQVPDAQIEIMLAPLRAQLAASNANTSGSGALAQGGGTALGKRSAQVFGDNFASIDTSTKIETQGGAVIEGSVRVRNGRFIGRDFVQYVTQIIQGGEDPEEANSVIALYLHALATDLAGVRLGEIDASVDQTRRDPLQLADIYVPLDTTLQIPKDTTLAQWLARDRTRKPERPAIEQRETRPVSPRSRRSPPIAS